MKTAKSLACNKITSTVDPLTIKKNMVNASSTPTIGQCVMNQNFLNQRMGESSSTFVSNIRQDQSDFSGALSVHQILSIEPTKDYYELIECPEVAKPKIGKIKT